jgi:hypothetical protein
MRIKFLIRILALLVLTTTVACSQAATPSLEKMEPAMLNQTVSGSYIVKASGDGEQVIRRVFAQYGVVLVRPLGNEQFELRLNRDPGLDTLKSMAAGSDGAVTAVQPNFVYHSD